MNILERLFSGPPNARRPQFDGLLYPQDPEVLASRIDALLSEAPVPDVAPKAMIVPHSEINFSWPVAASAYRCLQTISERVRRVVLVGPSQRVPFRGIGATADDAFETPLGFVGVDPDGYEALEGLQNARTITDAHTPEPSLEVQLPFLQTVLSDFSIVPLLVGDAEPGDVASAIARTWGDDETVIVVASELSRGLSRSEAVERDAQTVDVIESLDPGGLQAGDVVARTAVQGLLMVARQEGIAATAVDVRTSADTGGESTDEVVGYGSIVFHQPSDS